MQMGCELHVHSAPSAPRKLTDRADLCMGPLVQWQLGAQSSSQSDMPDRHMQLSRRSLLPSR